MPLLGRHNEICRAEYNWGLYWNREEHNNLMGTHEANIRYIPNDRGKSRREMTNIGMEAPGGLTRTLVRWKSGCWYGKRKQGWEKVKYKCRE